MVLLLKKEYGWTKVDKCQMWSALRTDVHRLCECRHWRHIRSHLADEVRKYEQIANTNVALGTWHLCRPWKLHEVRRCEQQSVPHCGVSQVEKVAVQVSRNDRS